MATKRKRGPRLVTSDQLLQEMASVLGITPKPLPKKLTAKVRDRLANEAADLAESVAKGAHETILTITPHPDFAEMMHCDVGLMMILNGVIHAMNDCGHHIELLGNTLTLMSKALAKKGIDVKFQIAAREGK